MKNSDINIRDPFVLCKDGIYYMYGTRANNFGRLTNGFDVYESRDLENWSEPKEVFNSNKFGLNACVNWAPEVHEYEGSYYMFATFTKENGLRGTYVLKSNSPDGNFEPHSNGAVTPFEWEALDGTFYVEDGIPYCVFCHEHTQILDGAVCYVELSKDLKSSVGSPVHLFNASSFLNKTASEESHNVTDGPFLYKKSDNTLLMIWSTVKDRNYCQCVTKSSNGKINGEWKHLEPIFTNDGGHGMIFKDFNGNLKLTLHSPNIQLEEKPIFFDIEETENSIAIKK